VGGLQWGGNSDLQIYRGIGRLSVEDRGKTQFRTVVPALAEILDEYRTSMPNPTSGVIFHFGNGCPMGMAGMGFVVASRRICMSWERVRK
jgi:hypothetical protein